MVFKIKINKDESIYPVEEKDLPIPFMVLRKEDYKVIKYFKKGNFYYCSVQHQQTLFQQSLHYPKYRGHSVYCLT